ASMNLMAWVARQPEPCPGYRIGGGQSAGLRRCRIYAAGPKDPIARWVPSRVRLWTPGIAHEIGQAYCWIGPNSPARRGPMAQLVARLSQPIGANRPPMISLHAHTRWRTTYLVVYGPS